MAMTIMLTLTAMFASERQVRVLWAKANLQVCTRVCLPQNVPRVSYVTYLDVWMLGCVFFVFMELVEFTLVLGLLKVGNARVTSNSLRAPRAINTRPTWRKLRGSSCP